MKKSVLFIILLFAVGMTAQAPVSYTHLEYSPDATIHAFALDTIHGVNYKFTIDQLGPDGVPLSMYFYIITHFKMYIAFYDIITNIIKV